MDKRTDNNLDAFFALIRSGLWEQPVALLPYMPIDFEKLNELAEKQSVAGLIAAGLEHVYDVKVTKQQALPLMNKALSLVKRNWRMNCFIGHVVDTMAEAGISVLLLKGQGIAQCYERPQWRAAGDVDFLLDNESYKKAKTLLLPLSSSSEPEGISAKHLGMTIGPWIVELHGTLHSGLSSRIDKRLDAIMATIFRDGNVRIWEDGQTKVHLLRPDEDAVYVFTHILQHFYKGGIGLRQICDWCRLLWTYREEIHKDVLEKRIREMGLMSEWKVFAAYLVEYLGMPDDAMPLYSDSRRWVRKAGQINKFILEVGNFGHNRDMSYYSKYPYLIRKTISLWKRVNDVFSHGLIFPIDSFRFLLGIVFNGLKSAAKGE